MADRFEDERKLAALTFEKRQIKDREKEINKEIAELEEKILERWEMEGLRGAPLADATLSMRKDGYIKLVTAGDRATPAEKAAVGQALKDAGYGHLVTEGFNSRSVSSVAKEERWDKSLPPELEGKIKYEPGYKIVVTEKKQDTDDDGAPEELAPAATSD